MGECKSSGNKQICKSLHELLTECFTSESANMPTCNRFLVSLPLEQFFSAVLLGIFPIQNLEPSAVLSLCDVGCRSLLGNDRGPCQQPPKLLFAIQQSLSSQVFPGETADF